MFSFTVLIFIGVKHWKWTEENIKQFREAVKNSTSISQIGDVMGFSHGNGARRRIKKAITMYCIPTDHLVGQMWSKGKTVLQDSRLCKYTPSEIFSENSPSTSSYIRRLVMANKLKPYECECCKISNWNGKAIGLQLDHVNGNRKDNRLENLRWLCPNCHSQTPTFCSKNRTTKNIYSDAKILELCKKCNNIHEVVKELGCNTRLYPRIRKLALSIGIEYVNYQLKTPTRSVVDPNWRHAPKPYCRKVSRPTKDELLVLIGEKPITSIGKQFGVTGNAVTKWCKSYGIQTMPNGYWQKKFHEINLCQRNKFGGK